jgi:hypothetical protein
VRLERQYTSSQSSHGNGPRVPPARPAPNHGLRTASVKRLRRPPVPPSDVTPSAPQHRGAATL